MDEKMYDEKSGKIGYNMKQINTKKATGQWKEREKLKFQEDENGRNKYNKN